MAPLRWRKLVMGLLLATMIAPIVLYTDRFGGASPAQSDDVGEEAHNLVVRNDLRRLNVNVVSQESFNAVKEQEQIHMKELPIGQSDEHKNWVLSISTAVTQAGSNNASKLIASAGLRDQYKNSHVREGGGSAGLQVVNGLNNSSRVVPTDGGVQMVKEDTSVHISENNGKWLSKQILQVTSNKQEKGGMVSDGGDNMPDSTVRIMRDQLIRGKIYLGLPPLRGHPSFVRELRARMRDIQRALGDATVDSQLPKNAPEKIKLMEQILSKGKQIQDDCSAVVKRLRASLHTAEDQLHAHKKQTIYLAQLAAKTVPRGLHCLPLRLMNEFYSTNSSKQQFPNQKKLENPKLYHYVLFSDNVLAAAVVVNSTISHAKNPESHVFHIVTDRLNYAAMRMWFLANKPGKATLQVQNIDEFQWLNSSYSPVLKQLESQSMINYYFKAHQAKPDENLKYRNPKYLSILNHLRFYIPEMYPKLQKVVFLDDDVVVQKDLSGLWSVDLGGKVNGAVETCGESFHRFDRYLNFSNPLIAKNFDPRACGWAYGMNIFDLDQWVKQNITDRYHSWQKLNEDRLLWKLGTLPAGLVTFWNRTKPLDRLWHQLGLGYNPNIHHRDIERAAVIHYNGNMKPWLEIALQKYRKYWTKYIDFDQPFLRDCNVNL